LLYCGQVHVKCNIKTMTPTLKKCVRIYIKLKKEICHGNVPITLTFRAHGPYRYSTVHVNFSIVRAQGLNHCGVVMASDSTNPVRSLEEWQQLPVILFLREERIQEIQVITSF